MIKFKCMYCGAKLKANDSSFGKKVHCPKCGRVIRATNANIIGDKAEKPKYIRESISTATDVFLKRPWTKRDKEKTSFFKRILIPQFDELTLFLMSVVMILLLLTNSGLRLSITCFASMDGQSMCSIILLLCFLFCGGVVSIFHAFSDKKKSYAEKMIMVVFAVALTAISGFCAAQYMLRSSSGWGLIFPAWNLINVGFIIFLFAYDVINEDSMADKDATTWQIVLGLAILLVVFVLCQYVFDLYWAVTMSVCVAYSTNFTLTAECKAEPDEDDW